MDWFFASGDLGFLWQEQIHAFSWLPKVFHPDQGFGYNDLLSLWLDYPFRVVIKLLSTIGLSWFVIEKLLWLGVFVLAIYSSYILAKYILGNNSSAGLASVIYSFNTYILLLFGGGQLGVALAYGISPFILMKFMQVIDAQTNDKAEISYKKNGINVAAQNGLWFALLITCDLRLAYLVLGAIVFYWLFCILSGRLRITGYGILYTFLIPAIVSVGVHAFWILPTILTGSGPASKGADFINPGMLRFLSVADLPHTISFLHPNWPDNLFGRVYFMQPEFLLVPVLAFSSLFLLRKNEQKSFRHLLFFNFMALIGGIFATGVNSPIGGVFQWMFIHVPGFVMFRDPTKLYLFVAIAYSVLIAYTFKELAGNSINKRILFTVIFIAYWCFSIRPVFMGQMSGNFQPVQLTDEYIRLKNMLVSDRKPSRVLWIPAADPFAFASDIHPLLSSGQVFGNASDSAVLSLMRQPDFMEKLYDAGVGYVIVPQDLGKRLFLNDYIFDPVKRTQLIVSLNNTSLTRDLGFTGIAVFYNHNFSMRTEIPAVINAQQKFADIGLVVSVISLVLSIGVSLIMKKPD